jgi:hypothetical protein
MGSLLSAESSFYGRIAGSFPLCRRGFTDFPGQQCQMSTTDRCTFRTLGSTIPGSGLDVQHREIGQTPAADARAGWAAGIGSTCRQGSDSEESVNCHRDGRESFSGFKQAPSGVSFLCQSVTDFLSDSDINRLLINRYTYIYL